MRITSNHMQRLIRESVKNHVSILLKENLFNLVKKHGKQLFAIAKEIITNPQMLNDLFTYVRINHPELISKTRDPRVNESLIDISNFELLAQVLSFLSVPAVLGWVKVNLPLGPKKGTIQITSPTGSTIRGKYIQDLNPSVAIKWPDGAITQPAVKAHTSKVGFFVDDQGKYHLEAKAEFFNDSMFERDINDARAEFVYKKQDGKFFVRVSHRGGLDISSSGATAQAVAGHFLIDFLRKAGYDIPPKANPQDQKPYEILTTGAASGAKNIEDCQVHFYLDKDIPGENGNPALKKDAVFTIEVKNTEIGWSNAEMEFDLGMVFRDDLSQVKVLNGMKKGYGQAPVANKDPFLSTVKDKDGNLLAASFWGDNEGQGFDQLIKGNTHDVAPEVRYGDPIAQGHSHYAGSFTQMSQAKYQDYLAKDSNRKLRVPNAEEMVRIELATLLKNSGETDHANVLFSNYKSIFDIVTYLKVLQQAVISTTAMLAFHVDQGKTRGTLPALDAKDPKKSAKSYFKNFNDIIENYQAYLTAVNNNAPYASTPGSGFLSGEAEDKKAEQMAKKHAESWDITQYNQKPSGVGVAFSTGIELPTYDVNNHFPVGTNVKITSGPGGIHSLKEKPVGKVEQSSVNVKRIVVRLPAPRVPSNGFDPEQPDILLLDAEMLEKIKLKEYNKAAKSMVNNYNIAKANYDQHMTQQAAAQAAADAQQAAEDLRLQTLGKAYYDSLPNLGGPRGKITNLNDAGAFIPGVTNQSELKRNKDTYFDDGNLTDQRREMLIKLGRYAEDFKGFTLPEDVEAEPEIQHDVLPVDAKAGDPLKGSFIDMIEPGADDEGNDVIMVLTNDAKLYYYDPSDRKLKQTISENRSIRISRKRIIKLLKSVL